MGNRRNRRRGKPLIRKVWASNLDYEMLMLDRCLERYSILSIDTEFPGCIRSTPRGSIEEQVYEDMRFNVNQTKVIQLGLTACDDSGKIRGSWEFNFSDFDPQVDACNPSSITFLTQNGLDFQKLKKDGIPLSLFAVNFLAVLHKNRIFRWVTFHGLYDIGYLLKAMGVGNELPESMEEFAKLVSSRIGNVRDLKHMAQFCEGLEEGKLGLERLGELLDHKRFGLKHHAGSDSLLTASLHLKMMHRFELDPEICDGYLYGFSNKLQSMAMNVHHLYHKIDFGNISYSIPLYCTPSPTSVTYY